MPKRVVGRDMRLIVSFIAALSVVVALLAVGAQGCKKNTSGQSAQQTRVSASELLAEARSGGFPVFLSFHSNLCQACVQLDAAISEVEPEYAGRVVFISVDVYDQSEQSFVESYQVETIPYTLLMDAGGAIVNTFKGAVRASDLRIMLDGLAGGAGVQ